THLCLHPANNTAYNNLNSLRQAMILRYLRTPFTQTLCVVSFRVECLNALDKIYSCDNNCELPDEGTDDVVTKITEVVLSLRILGNSLPILQKHQLSCMT
ncbi:hypothetical protein L9F63_023361, partial [Diploptera punctata]